MVIDRENLYEFGKYIRDTEDEPYFTIPRLKRISKQVLEALMFVHSLGLIHCDIKPEVRAWTLMSICKMFVCSI